MGKAKRLTEEDRAFLSQVAKIVFTNWFSPEIREALATVTGETGQRGEPRHFLNTRPLGPRLEQYIRRLEQRGIRTVSDVEPPDRRLLEYAFLLQIYLTCVEELDALIDAQIEMGPRPAPVRFAKRTLAAILARGFTEPEACRYFALYYQFRRAFYFIAYSLVGGSDAMQALRFALWNNVFTPDARTYDRYLWNRMEDFSTLLLGETGTGKGAAAAAIGRSGFIPFDTRTGRFTPSFSDSFIAINLSQYPESLIESELFGHRKGAFTGAVDSHRGVFERCDANGALLLGEIGEVSIPIQIKLLQVLQERTFTALGDHAKLQFSGRVIAATNRPLNRLRREGRFRDDFFYRLCSDLISVPPLRLRLRQAPGELAELVALLLRRMTGQPGNELTERVLATLHKDLPPDYPWPGNVRELEQPHCVDGTVRRTAHRRSSRQVPCQIRGGGHVDGRRIAQPILPDALRAPRYLQRSGAARGAGSTYGEEVRGQVDPEGLSRETGAIRCC